MQRRSLLTSVALAALCVMSTPASAQAHARVEAEMPKWARLVKERGITAE